VDTAVEQLVHSGCTSTGRELRVCTRSHPAELRRHRSLSPRVIFGNEALNAVLHLSELSDQLDVTLENSTIVKVALNWIATTQSDAIK
jgi:hypothetical protein